MFVTEYRNLGIKFQCIVTFLYSMHVFRLMLPFYLFVLQDDMEKFPFSNEYQDFNLPETLNPLSSDKSSEGTGYGNVHNIHHQYG